MYVPMIIAVVIVSCCVNVVFLEAIVKLAPGSGNLITFSQFAFVSIEGFLFQSKCGRTSPVIPLKKYLWLVILFFLVSVSNNYALKFNISVPLHIIFRSVFNCGSLLANLILGIVILKRSYSLCKYASVAVITVGIIIATLSSSQSKPPSHIIESNHVSIIYSANDFIIGILLLSFALIASARCGIYQEVLFATFGKHAKEALYYTHVLSLPGFIFLLPDIYQQSLAFNASTALSSVPLIPRLWFYLLINACTQYCCIMSVLVLMTECTSLTVTLVLTIRKFLSLIFSIYYFNNRFTEYHWLGTVMVFGGTFLFMDLSVVNSAIDSCYKRIVFSFNYKTYEALLTRNSVITIEPRSYHANNTNNT